jgi:hypothetical protein
MVADWVAALPQVPTTMGMKKARATICSSCSAFHSMMDVDSSEVNKQNRQPAESAPEQPRHRPFEVLLLEGHHGRNTLKVLGVFGLDDVDDVVDGDHAQKPVLLVDHRHGEEVVFLDLGGGRLDIQIVGHRDDVRLHDLGELGLGLGHDQIAQGDHAEQVAAAVRDVDVVDGLLVGRLQAQAFERLAHADVGRKRAVLGGHDRPGRPLLVVPQAPDLVALGLGDQGHDGFADVGVDGLEQIDPVVGFHVLDELEHGPGVAGLQAGLLGFDGELLEGLQSLVVADLDQSLDDVERAQAAVFEMLRGIGRVEFAQRIHVVGFYRPAGRSGFWIGARCSAHGLFLYVLGPSGRGQNEQEHAQGQGWGVLRQTFRSSTGETRDGGMVLSPNRHRWQGLLPGSPSCIRTSFGRGFKLIRAKAPEIGFPSALIRRCFSACADQKQGKSARVGATQPGCFASRGGCSRRASGHEAALRIRRMARNPAMAGRMRPDRLARRVNHSG